MWDQDSASDYQVFTNVISTSKRDTFTLSSHFTLVYFSSKNRVYVHFHSDAAYNFKGFNLKWSTACGQSVTDSPDIGVFHNKNFGIGPYFPDQDCRWFVESSNEYDLIRMKILSMDLKSSPSNGCSGDFLGFYSGGKVEGDETLIRKSCGSSDAGTIISSRGRMIMRFFTDQSPQDGNRAGWEVEYFIGGCGGYVKDQNGTIDSYSHALEGLDSKQVNCTWVLEAEGFGLIKTNLLNKAYSNLTPSKPIQPRFTDHNP